MDRVAEINEEDPTVVGLQDGYFLLLAAGLSTGIIGVVVTDFQLYLSFFSSIIFLLSYSLSLAFVLHCCFTLVHH